MAFMDADNSPAKSHPSEACLFEAAKRVSLDYNFPGGWLNTGPSSIIDLGLPEGLMSRAKAFRYGNKLTVFFIDRYDQIHFKLYAAADSSRASVHYQDLTALKPAEKEITCAAPWCMTQDASENFKIILKDLLENMGFKKTADGI